jgi:hypothetical protein
MRASWIIGPVLGVLLVATAFLAGFGPGFLVLSIYGAIAFIFVVPALQLALGRTPWFRNRILASNVVAVSFVVAGLFTAVMSGHFFYW